MSKKNFRKLSPYPCYTEKTENMFFPASLVPLASADLHYGLRSEFMADQCLEKVNLVIGAYRDDGGQPWVLPTVAQVAMDTPVRDPVANTPVLGNPALLR